MSDVSELAANCRDGFLGAWDEVRPEETVWDHHGDELAYINHLAEGEEREPKPDLIASLRDAARYMNVHAPPGLGAVAPLDGLERLHRRVSDAEGNKLNAE